MYKSKEVWRDQAKFRGLRNDGRDTVRGLDKGTLSAFGFEEPPLWSNSPLGSYWVWVWLEMSLVAGQHDAQEVQE